MPKQLSDLVHPLPLLVGLDIPMVNSPVCLMFYSVANKEEWLSAFGIDESDEAMVVGGAMGFCPLFEGRGARCAKAAVQYQYIESFLYSRSPYDIQIHCESRPVMRYCRCSEVDSDSPNFLHRKENPSSKHE